MRSGECACTGECFVLGRRAALAGLDHSPPRTDATRESAAPIESPARDTRANVWRLAGLERTAEDLPGLQGDPHPLARLVAACALAREATRGAHPRAEFPERDHALDGRHTILATSANAPTFAPWE